MLCIQKESHYCEGRPQFERQENFKFCQKLDRFASEMFQMIKQAQGEEALNFSAVFRQHKGRVSSVTDPCISGAIKNKLGFATRY
jgi:hypothetical protein